MLTLYHSGLSTCSKQVRHCLKEKGIPYESRYVELWRYENLNPWYLQWNPNGVVPALDHDGTAIYNAVPILEYIEDAFPGRPLRPEDPKLRWKMRHWMWMGDYVHQAIINLTFSARLQSLVEELSEDHKTKMIAHSPMPDRRERWRRLSTGGYTEDELRAALDIIEYTVAWLERELSQSTWIAGEEMSLADVYVLSNVHRIRELHPEKVEPERFPKVNAWRDRLMARPAAAEAYAPGTAETPPRPDGKSIEGIDMDLQVVLADRAIEMPPFTAQP